MASACTGLKVMEITRGMAGALAGMVLADHGAEVVRLESPSGDPYTSEAGARLWNRGKQRIALDLRDAEQRRQALELARRADVVLLGLRPTSAEAWGLTYENLGQSNPGLVLATISGFGWRGPYRDTPAIEGLVHALSGSMLHPQNAGYREGPIFVTPRIASYSAAMLCVQGILAALHVRQATGLGQQVDTSLLHGLLCYRVNTPLKVERHQEELPPLRLGTEPRGARPLFNLNECADGRWIGMAAFTRAFCEQALAAMGLSSLLEEPAFAGMPNTYPDPDAQWALLNILWDTFRTEPRETWLRRMNERNVPCEPVLTVEEFRKHPQLWANEAAVTVQDPIVGPMVQPGVLGRLSATPGEIRPAEAATRPSSAVQETLGRWSERAGAHTASAATPADQFSSGPLTGIRVLDFTAFLAGPMCTRLLADLGAEVIKVESLQGDSYRTSARGSFMLVNRGKRSLALDLKLDDSREVLHRLVGESDVVVYNFRLGVERRLGLDYETLHELNPRIIVCPITGFGSDGAEAHRPAYDTSMGSLSGIDFEQAGEGNAPVGFGAGDITSGLAAATAIMLALQARDVTGSGQLVDVSMIGAMAFLMADRFTDYAGKPEAPQLDQGQHGMSALYRLYPTQDGWLFIAAVRDEHRQALHGALRVLESPIDVLDSACYPQGRDDQLAIQLGQAFRGRPTAAWLAALQPAGVPYVDPLVDLQRFVLEQQDFDGNGLTVVVPHGHFGTVTEAGAGQRLSRTPCRIERAEPSHGEHTEELLREAGIAPEMIRQLQQDGAVVLTGGA